MKVVNRNAVGVANILVRAASTNPAYSPPAQRTDANGCVIFRQVPVATYTITLDEAGYVGTNLAQLTQVDQKATPGNVTFKTIEYDLATRARVTVKTTPPGASITQQDSKAAKVSLTNAKNTGLLKSYVNPAPPAAFDVSPLFPFKDTAYGFFTGSCRYESPDTYVPDYFTSNPGSLLADPTKPQPQAVTVLQPPFNIRVGQDYGGDTTPDASKFLIYATLLKPDGSTDPCTEPVTTLTFMNWAQGYPAGTWGTPPGTGAPPTNWVSQPGTLFDPGMPYGTYRVCVVDKTPKPDRYATFTYDNRAKAGAGTTVTIGGTGTNWNTTTCA